MSLDHRHADNAYKRYHSDKHLSEFLPRIWRQISFAIDMEQNYMYVTVTLCIKVMSTVAYSTYL